MMFAFQSEIPEPKAHTHCLIFVFSDVVTEMTQVESLC